jgi:hypothetical protein
MSAVNEAIGLSIPLFLLSRSKDSFPEREDLEPAVEPHLEEKEENELKEELWFREIVARCNGLARVGRC